MTLTGAILLARDPELLERRLRAREKDLAQGRIVVLAGMVFLALLLIPAFDRRFGWSRVPLPAVVAADVVVLVAYGLFIRVLRENRSASRVIEVQLRAARRRDRPVRSRSASDVYGLALISLATPVALGSWWAFIPAGLLLAVLAERIKQEERVLTAELTGYREYMQTTVYRLIPGVW